jgi:hypothetical protein
LWGLGGGARPPTPNPQTPNPQSPIKIKYIYKQKLCKINI